MKRIGLLGGTFNPVHFGHLAMAQLALERMSLDKVIFIPSNIPPHKNIRDLAPSQTRFNMVKLAIKGNSAFDVSNFEIKKAGKSYSIDTVIHFQKIYPKGTKLFFIIGEDAVWHLSKWKRIEDIRKIVTFIVVNRPGYINREGRAKHYYVEMPAIDIASSFLRKRITKGEPIDYFVPNGVSAYIKKHRLYKKS